MMGIITDFDIDGMRQGIIVHDKIRQASKPAVSLANSTHAGKNDNEKIPNPLEKKWLKNQDKLTVDVTITNDNN